MGYGLGTCGLLPSHARVTLVRSADKVFGLLEARIVEKPWVVKKHWFCKVFWYLDARIVGKPLVL